jgi:hypothetical protein
MIPWQNVLKAQPYNHAVGVRAGYSSGISYKGFRLHKMWAIEADILYNPIGLNVGGLFEYHLEPFYNKRTFIYLGGGVFGGTREDAICAGVAAVTGIEYVLRDLPLDFTLNWKPMLYVYELFEPGLLDFGITIRYHFGS